MDEPCTEYERELKRIIKLHLGGEITTEEWMILSRNLWKKYPEQRKSHVDKVLSSTKNRQLLKEVVISMLNNI